MNPNNFFTEHSYSILISLAFFGIYLYFNLKIAKAENKKILSIRKRSIDDAVETDSPLDDQEKSLKAKGIVGIEDRFSFIKKVLPFILIVMWGFAVAIPYLDQIPTVYVSLLAAVLSVVVGVSLRPFLENLFSGIVISFFKSVKIGDTVIIDGQYGLIEEISFTYSVLKRWDWVRIIVPNSKLLNKEIEHLTMNDRYIWAHVEFYVAPESNLKKVEELAKEVAKKSDYFNNIEEPSFWVMDLQKDAVKCWLAAWCDSPSEAWELRNEMRTQLLIKLQQNNISFHNFNINSNN